jgi:dihydrodipicolinate synthase/N-acetylneuraminate lyase
MVEQIRGIVLPSPTVFLEDGSVDEKLMRALTDWYLACGVHARSYGQGPAMTPDERKKVAEAIVQQVKHRVPVIVHVGAVDPYTAIDLGKHARAIGAEAIGHVGPYYYADRSEYEIIEHFKMVDRAVGLPILVYNNPRYSGYNIHPSLMARLVEAVPRIFGAKLAMGSVDADGVHENRQGAVRNLRAGEQSGLGHGGRRCRHDQPTPGGDAGNRRRAGARRRSGQQRRSFGVAKDGDSHP